MRLADRIAQNRDPFIVQSAHSGRVARLNGASDFADAIARCPLRYVLSDDLTRLCAALAYSKGTRTLACADLLHVPAECLWVEWCEAPWRDELKLYGFHVADDAASQSSGRRGALIRSSPDGRHGLIRTFWTAESSERDVLASSMEAYFDFDTPDGEVPRAPGGDTARLITVFDAPGRADILRRCLRFRFELSWAEYYARASLAPAHMDAVARHALGTIAIDIPLLLTFLLLLMTRPGVPRRPLMLERLNKSRIRSGKPPLLQHTEVCAPLLPDYRVPAGTGSSAGRCAPRLHHVRGHLVRRGSQLSWRVPHLRGSARTGIMRSRTVTWTIDGPAGAPGGRPDVGPAVAAPLSSL